MSKKQHKTAIIIGNNVSALVCAMKLQEAMVPVRIISPSHHFGGIFSGIKFGENHFDIGSISLEFDLLNSDQDSDILSYSDTQLNDSSRFTDYVKELYDSLNIDTHKIPSPKMFLNGKIEEDCILANNLTFLQNLSNQQKVKISQNFQI